LKPQNILVTLDDVSRVKLVDFGSGSLVDGKQDKLTGTPLYMSPEQSAHMQEFQRTGVLPATNFDPYMSDVYSLGMTFLHVALMEPPIQILTSNRDAALVEYLAMLSASYPTVYDYLKYMLVANGSGRCTFESTFDHLHQLLYPQSAGSGQVPAQLEPQPTYYVPQSDPQYVTDQSAGSGQVPAQLEAQPTYYAPQSAGSGQVPAQLEAQPTYHAPQLNLGYEQADQAGAVGQGQPPNLSHSYDLMQQGYAPAENPVSLEQQAAVYGSFWIDPDLLANTPLATWSQAAKEEKLNWLYAYTTDERDITNKVNFLIRSQCSLFFEPKISLQCSMNCQTEVEISEDQESICTAHWVLCGNCIQTHAECPHLVPKTPPR